MVLLPRIVLDTSVVVSALIGPEGNPHHRLRDKVASGAVTLAVGDEFFREPYRVAGYPDVGSQIVSADRALRYGLDLGFVGRMLRLADPVRDRNDGRMLNLAWMARAPYMAQRWGSCHRGKRPAPDVIALPASTALRSSQLVSSAGCVIRAKRARELRPSGRAIGGGQVAPVGP